MSSAQAQLAMWIEQEHPALFADLYAAAVRGGINTQRKTLKGFGDDSGFALPDLSSYDSSFNASDLSPDFSDVPLQTVSLDMDTISAPSIGTDPSSSGGGLLSTIGGSLANAAESVGSYLTSAQGVNTLANLGTAYFKTQGAIAQQQTQAQILQAQIVAAQNGQSPYPVTYMTGTNGQAVPVYVTQPSTGIAPGSYGNAATQLPEGLQQAIANGTAQEVTLPDGSIGYTITPSILSTLTSNPLLWLLAAGIVLAALL